MMGGAHKEGSNCSRSLKPEINWPNYNQYNQIFTGDT